MRCTGPIAIAVAVLAAGTLRAADTSPSWETAFPIKSAPERVHFRAHYFDEGGRAHALEVWRDSNLRLRRNTDGRLELYVEKSSSGEYEYRLIDRSRNVLIRAQRPSLFRIGMFPDWTGLAHVLNVPRGGYRITGTARQSPASLRGDCAWQRLEVLGPAPMPVEICWSAAWGLPWRIDFASHAGEAKPRFSLDDVATFEPAAGLFEPNGAGLVELDADPDGELSD